MHSVDAGSPASACGIRPNDTIASIAGDTADQLSMLALRRRLCSEGKEVRMVIKRDEKLVEVTLILGKSRLSGISGVSAKQN